MLTNPLHLTRADTSENREEMFQAMLQYDQLFMAAGMPIKRRGFPFFLVTRRGLLGCVTGPDAVGAEFIVAQWSSRSGVKRIDLPRSEVLFVSFL